MADRDPKELHQAHDAQHYETVLAVDAPQVPVADKRRKRLKILLGLAAAKVVNGGAWWLMSDGDHVMTDNAYVNADSAQVTALVSGPIRSVEVVNTEVVRRGQ